MAIKVEFEVNLSKELQKILRDAEQPIDKATMEQVGKDTVNEMKAMIASGISPLEGYGKFPAYKNPKKYPGKRKPRSPVNLKLSGDFQDALTSRVTTGSNGFSAEIFYAGKEEVKEKGHREGANGQPKRPTIPASKGQDFAVRIREVYNTLIKDRILEVIKGRG